MQEQRVDLETKLNEILPATASSELRAEVAAQASEYDKHMSPEGALGLPELLDQRRLRYAIPDEAFRVQATFDRVLLWQITDFEGGKLGLIDMPDRTKDRLQREAPRAVLISAGLRALDVLRSNGYELGQIVRFVNAQPWRIPCAYIGGHFEYVFPMNVGDLTGSEDLADALRAGRETIERKQDKDGNMVHVLSGRNAALQPWAGDDQ